MAVSGDNANAKKVVSRLTNNMGFNMVDSSSLSESWRHQPNTPAYCTELNTVELKQGLADGDEENSGQVRDFAITKLMECTTQPSHDEVLALNRSLFTKNPETL